MKTNTKTILFLLPILISLLSLNSFGADNKVAIKDNKIVVEKKSFVEGLSLRPYYSGFASLEKDSRDFDFNHGAAGLELALPIYKDSVSLVLDAVGIDNVSDDPVIDRAGLGLEIKFPVKRSKLEFYGQTSVGFWFGEEELDIVLRGGARYNFSKRFGLFSDIGTGISMQDGNAYQQLRVGFDIGF